MRLIFFVCAGFGLACLSGSVPDIGSTAPESAETFEGETDSATEEETSAGAESSSTTLTSSTSSTAAASTTENSTADTAESSTSTTTAPTSTTSSTTTTTATTTSTTTASTTATTVQPVGYSDWATFWSVFSQAAAAGDLATIEALTADDVTIAFAGGSVFTQPGTKSDITGNFTRPQETFESGRQTLSDGTPFEAALRSPPGSGLFDHFEIPYDMAYSIFIEESEGGPAVSMEYIFRKIDDRFLLVGYSVDS